MADLKTMSSRQGQRQLLRHYLAYALLFFFYIFFLIIYLSNLYENPAQGEVIGQDFGLIILLPHHLAVATSIAFQVFTYYEEKKYLYWISQAADTFAFLWLSLVLVNIYPIIKDHWKHLVIQGGPLLIFIALLIFLTYQKHKHYHK